MSRRIWVYHPAGSAPNTDTGGNWHDPEIVSGPYRVLRFQKFLPAGGSRKKHLVKLWTDPGGVRVLAVGGIRLKDPGRVAGQRNRATEAE